MTMIILLDQNLTQIKIFLITIWECWIYDVTETWLNGINYDLYGLDGYESHGAVIITSLSATGGDRVGVVVAIGYQCTYLCVKVDVYNE